MANKFVSAGSINAATGEVAADADAAAVTSKAASPPSRNAEWEAVQKQLEEERWQREEARRSAAAQDGTEKSLYEVLQANKAAKQAAFEEANKIKNQFRALDDDDIDFLDGVRAAAKAAEERLKRETEDGIKAFREAQRKEEAEAGEDADDAADGNLPEYAWTLAAPTASTRRRGREGLVKGVKRKASLGAADGRAVAAGSPRVVARKMSSKGDQETKKSEHLSTEDGAPRMDRTPANQATLSLVQYGSSDEEEAD